MFLFWFSTFFFLFFWWCMYVYDHQWVRMYVCKWLILYIWCSLRWKSRRCPGLILFFFYFLDPAQYLWVFSDNYAREWFSDCWMWFYWERSSVDWLFVRVNLKKKKRPYYLIFSVVKKKKKFKQIWESGALVLWRSIALVVVYMSGLFFFFFFIIIL